MGLTDIKNELKKLDKNKLIDLVAELYKKNKSVKEFFDFYINPDEKELFNKYRYKVFEAFYPTRGYKYNLKDGKQAISNFKKLGPSPIWLADLMLYYVETGIKFTNDFGDLDEGFYSSMETTYVAALTLMKKESLLDKFADRAGKVVSDTSDIGWGLHYYLGDVFASFYPDNFDDKGEATDQQEIGKVIKLGRKWQ